MVQNTTNQEGLKYPEITIKSNYYVWNKGDVGLITEHFDRKNFSCHCSFPDCKEQKINKDLVDKLELIRSEIKQPLIVTSAFRCVAYQKQLEKDPTLTVVAKTLSQHELGNAADIVPKDGLNVRTQFQDICAKQFTSIGLSDKFLHVDLRPGYRRWEY